jgi:hypothetical protein
MDLRLANRSRIVDSVSILRTPISFREVCERAVPPETRLLVMDLDRTLHLRRNMGELLGWELSAYQGYGPSYLTELEPRRHAGRMYIAWQHPLRALRYLANASRLWVPPGLFYLWWCKIAARVGFLRRLSYARFGPEPVTAVQRIPQDVLFRQIASLDSGIVRELAKRVWARYAPDQTVEREDLDWVRRRCPNIRIVLSSASPTVMTELVARELGFDDAIGSTPGHKNSGRAKLETLLERSPALRTPGEVTVGISDTGYGEDHCWTEAFTHLVDVNSTSPFSPLVAGSSPLQAIFSASILTRAEKREREKGRAWLDPRRGKKLAGGSREFRHLELEALLAPLRGVVDRLSSVAGQPLARTAFKLAQARERARQELEYSWASSALP